MNQKNRGGVLNTPNVSFVEEDNSVRYLLEYEDPYNGHEYVDLGLPSGLKWATCNVGADNPQDKGLFFVWGETQGYMAEQIQSGVRTFDWESFKAGPAYSYVLTLNEGDICDLAHDGAHVNMGGNWRMPTKDEFQELIDNCNSVWVNDYNGTGIKGYIVTSNINGKSIFMPLTTGCQEGYYIVEMSFYHTSTFDYFNENYNELYVWSAYVNGGFDGDNMIVDDNNWIVESGNHSSPLSAYDLVIPIRGVCE